MRSPPTRSRMEWATDVLPEPVPPATPNATRWWGLTRQFYRARRSPPVPAARSGAVGEERRLRYAEHLQVARELPAVMRFVREEGEDHVLERRGETGDRVRQRHPREPLFRDRRELTPGVVGDRRPRRQALGERRAEAPAPRAGVVARAKGLVTLPRGCPRQLEGIVGFAARGGDQQAPPEQLGVDQVDHDSAT